MNKLLRNQFVIVLISVVFSIMLCAYVYSNVSSLSTSSSNSASVTTTKDVSNVPIKIIDSSNTKYVSGLPETVTVHLTGPRNLLTQLNEQTLTVETTDLADIENGTRTIHFTVTGLPSLVSATVTPVDTQVSIEDLVMAEVNVVGVVPEEIIAEGYTVGNVTVNPEKVTLSGSAQAIAKVASVTATIPVTTQTQNQTFTQSNVTVVVKDDAGNILDVKVSRTVSVTVQLTTSQVSAPIDTVLTNQNASYNYTITNQNFYTTMVVNTTANSPRLTALVDVVSLTEGTHTLTVPVLASYGITSSQIREVTLTIQVSPK